MEKIKDLGVILSCLSTIFALYALVKAKVLTGTKSYVVKESGKEDLETEDEKINRRLDLIEGSMERVVENNSMLSRQIDEFFQYQTRVNRKTMADIIETAYHVGKEQKAIDVNSFRHLSEVYDVYHNPPTNGNSYISSIWEEMCGWERF